MRTIALPRTKTKRGLMKRAARRRMRSPERWEAVRRWTKEQLRRKTTASVSFFPSFPLFPHHIYIYIYAHSYSLLIFLCFSSSVAGEIQIIVVNNCRHSVWPGILGGAGNPTPEDGGFHVSAGEEAVFSVPTGWSGRIWGRQGCSFDEHGKGSCDTGDCSGVLHCRGMGGAPPATVVEMTFGTARSPLHFYDVSLVDGFNLPVTMSPIGGGIGCGVAGCEVNLNVCCPSKFEVTKKGKVVGCKSACLALQTDKYCCTGDYGSPNSCKPTLFSHLFKSICPRAYSFAYDDPSSLNKCRASRYLVTFCPPR